MLLVGLTGGIGSGKSTVARMLQDRGAVVIDADELAREAVEAGTAGHRAVVQAFGPRVVGTDGTIDRTWLARRVFDDPAARDRLEAIVHPEVARLFADRVAPYRGTDRIVVYVVPLLVERSMQDAVDVVITISAPEDVRADRLHTGRGIGAADSKSRMSAQAADGDRERAADIVIRNAGSMSELEGRVAEVWTDLSARVGSA